MTTSVQAPPKSLDDVPGWFHSVDRLLFTWLLTRQERTEPPGDLVELGAYMGKSAIGIGASLREGETFTVCDLFGAPAPNETNRRAAQYYTDHLTRESFERNYLAFHDRLPEVLQAPTSAILDHTAPSTCRFVHIDASHLYDLVRGDIRAARTMLRTGGVLAMDDYRTAHTPGTAAAVWEAVLNDDLRPICLTGMKFYATWGDPDPIQDDLLSWAASQPGLRISVDQVAGRRLLRASLTTAPTAGPAPAQAAPATPPSRSRPAPRASRRPLLARVALDATPPDLTRAVRRARRALAS